MPLGLLLNGCAGGALPRPSRGCSGSADQRVCCKTAMSHLCKTLELEWSSLPLPRGIPFLGGMGERSACMRMRRALDCEGVMALSPPLLWPWSSFCVSRSLLPLPSRALPRASRIASRSPSSRSPSSRSPALEPSQMAALLSPSMRTVGVSPTPSPSTAPRGGPLLLPPGGPLRAPHIPRRRWGPPPGGRAGGVAAAAAAAGRVCVGRGDQQRGAGDGWDVRGACAEEQGAAADARGGRRLCARGGGGRAGQAGPHPRALFPSLCG